MRAQTYRQNNKEDIALNQAERYQKFKESIRERNKIYYESNRQTRMERMKTYYGNNENKILQQQKKKASEVREGYEFGTLIDAKIEIAPGDRVEAVKTVEKK
jgi:hypothetical protein